MADERIGEIIIQIKPGEDGGKDQVQISTSFTVPELNLVLDHIKKMIVEGELTLGEE
jgi:hypothetical protein